MFNLSINFDFFNTGFHSGTKSSSKNIANGAMYYIDNPVYKNLQTKNQIMQKIATNSHIMDIIRENNISVEINEIELQDLMKRHLSDTKLIVSKIYIALPNELKKDINLNDLQTAAMLHDYGKVLIPKEILNKKGKLTKSEEKIMQLHSELGYELLKDMDINENVLNLIKYHHQNQKKSGYPAMGNLVCNLEIQILNIADKYSALTEKRKYKKAFAKYDALEVIAEDVNKGLISQDVYTALAKVV